MAQQKKKVFFSNERGFTLSEVLVAVGVFSILAAIAVPNFVAMMPTYRLNGAARAVFSDLMWARTKAVEENNQFVVSLPNNTSLKTLDDDDNNGGENVGVEWTRTRNIQTDYPNVTLTITAGPDPTFNSRGTAGGVTTITVSNGGDTRTVTVRSTGIVNID